MIVFNINEYFLVSKQVDQLAGQGGNKMSWLYLQLNHSILHCFTVTKKHLGYASW